MDMLFRSFFNIVLLFFMFHSCWLNLDYFVFDLSNKEGHVMIIKQSCPYNVYKGRKYF